MTPEHRVNPRYAKSVQQLSRAEQVIPLGSQTFSKSKVAFPVGASPLFLQRGQGSRVWDVDGNEYIDFVSGLLAVFLGYRDADVDAAVVAQLEQGVSFSLAHPLEAQLAEKIVDVVPCAESVRFGKNGSDATAGAIRLARAFTGREKVAVCGYHGWQDWYIGSTTRDRGVPASTKALTHTFRFNDLASLEALFEQMPETIAAVILEPMNTTWPEEGFLEEVVRLAREHGALSVFDETITGFRFALGGAQELFGVTPDLATFGKGLSNGFPLSVLCGRKDVMALMTEIFFSFTFGGEAASLAAANAVIDKLRAQPVIERVHALGSTLLDGVNYLVAKHGCSEFISTSGHPAWSFLHLKEPNGAQSLLLRTLFLQEMHACGVLLGTTHNLTYAHSDGDIDALLQAYDQVLPELRAAVLDGDIRSRIVGRPLEPLFSVR